MAPEPADNEPLEETPSGDVKSFVFDDLPPSLRSTVDRLDWKAPMPVQERVIPFLLDGKDVVVQSRTGSGKTGAFVLPLCMRVDPRRDEVQGLVLVPTRELAEQVYGVLKELSKDTGIRSVAVYGGVGYGPQIEAFKEKVHIIVATPGRMIDHLTSRRVSLSYLRHLVLDEADEMLSMGFYKSMIKILSYIPEKRQTSLFSATIPPGVASLASRFTRDPETISLSSDIMHVEEVDHVYYVSDAMYKDRALLKLIDEAALIFCNTKKEVEYLGTFLRNFGYDGDYLSGDLTQAERDKVMTRIRKGRLRFLVATDVAARGIDISELGYVILYNLPQAHDHYIHRAGRTGRAGEGGIAISLVAPLEEPELKKRAKHFGLTLIKKELPTDEEVEKKVAERLRVMVEEKHRNMSNLEKERLGRFLSLSRSMQESGEAVELVAMLFDRFYQETLHAPLYPREEPSEKSTDSRRRNGRDRRDSRGGRRDREGGRGRSRGSDRNARSRGDSRRKRRR
jgi:ATP-dependent RNA helicase DeaD